MSELVCPACGAPLPDEPLLCGVDRLHGVPGKFSVLVCTACGSGRTLPLVGSQELHTLYPDDYNAFALPANPALRALATALFRSRYRRSLRGGALATLRTREPGRLLDVGSGRGDLGLVLRERGWQVTGLEPSADAVEHARARGIETVQGTLTGGAAVGSGYDAVVFNHSLEHVVEPLEDLQAAWAVLSDGGVLVVSGPNFGSWQRRRFEESWFHLDLPRHRSHFTRAGLERLLARVGYGEIATSTTTSADGLPMSLQYRAFGRRALDSGVGRYAFVGATLLATPVTATVGRVAGEGDLLHAVAVKEGFSRGG